MENRKINLKIVSQKNSCVLSNFIVFPNTTVPLNIFEPRYLKMTEDAMASNRLIGMIQPKKW